jgi:hypothetical protein
VNAVANPITYFLENFGKRPAEKPPIIPGPWRIPFFVALSLVSLAVLVALVYYVVSPAIHAQQVRSAAPAPAAASD